LKRPLRILGEPGDKQATPPTHLELGGHTLSIADAHDGSEAARFAELLVAVGARRVDASKDPHVHLRIIVRSTPESPEARLRAEVLEEGAHLVLGSARPVMAELLAARLGGAR
jgi:hypothetical protein